MGINALRFMAAGVLAAASLSAAAVGRHADITIHDRATGRNLPVHWHEGKAYVVGAPGNEYSVVVRNRSGEDLLAVVSVDGVNAVTGQTAAMHQAGYVLRPRERLDVKGWRKSLQETAAFYFTSLGDSYAGRTGRPDNVGVIGVALFERERPLPPPPRVAPPEVGGARRDEAPAAAASQEKRSAGPTASAPLGTGHGRRESSHAQHAEFDRAPHPVETVTIHYDSYRNLVAMGVLQQVGRRDPDPFPAGFVPDPGYRRY